MKRGFPRPQTKVKTIGGTWLYRIPGKARAAEKRNSRGKILPHPYTAQDNEIAKSHDGRIYECVAFKRCVVCGLAVKNENVWVYRERQQKSLYSDSGPFHDKCKRLTQALCPVMRYDKETNNKDGFEFVRVPWKEIYPHLIYRARNSHGMRTFAPPDTSITECEFDN